MTVARRPDRRARPSRPPQDRPRLRRGCGDRAPQFTPEIPELTALPLGLNPDLVQIPENKVKKAIRDASKQPPVRTYLNIMRIQERLLDEMQNLHRANGLTQAQFNVLRTVYCAGGQGVPCKDIGERLVNRDPDVTGLIDRLSAAGWVKRVRDTEDRRRVLVHLTDAGRDLIERTTPTVVRRHYAQFAYLSGAELEELNHLLVKARSDRPETSARR